MRYDKLTVKAQEALQEADSLAHTFSHPALEVEHLLLALVEQKDGVVPPILERIGADASEVSSAIRHAL
ncbi:MAG TPA: Clp protease N-terminal domain-containing protein, partial [Spirochaetia bacterium]|nr:Clp protease N-terminal domain-containing protein [Spirochaetia bacterium]